MKGWLKENFHVISFIAMIISLGVATLSPLLTGIILVNGWINNLANKDDLEEITTEVELISSRFDNMSNALVAGLLSNQRAFANMPTQTPKPKPTPTQTPKPKPTPTPTKT